MDERSAAAVAVQVPHTGAARVPSGSPDPVFILSPPCTFSWVVCAIVGQHPEMYALPELHLFTADTIAEWWDLCSHATFEMDHGLVRAVAELYFGGQTEAAVSRARGWLRRRSHYTTGLLLETIAERLEPLVAVEKSPSTAHSTATLERTFGMFPNARYIHLVSHPRLYCEAVLDALGNARRGNELPPTHWLAQLAPGPELDPQLGWLAANLTIAGFLARVPADRQKVVRGEDILGDGTAGLVALAAWLGVRTDPEAIEEMRHPERSAYVAPGPPSAAFGSDRFLRPGPLVRSEWSRPRCVDGPLAWRSNGRGFLPEVKRTARELGYT
ncbi:MAG TPA: sulfotransferase [Polyangia bacterium]|nr:sulfotransferase [Polyangia bacterium]